MRRTLIGLATLGVLLVPAVPAWAAHPLITPGVYFEAVVPFPDICPDFELTATVRGKPHAITFVDGSGDPVRGFAAGQLSVTWVRDDTGFARRFTISGPTFLDASGDPVRGTGRWTTPVAGTGWALVNGNLTLDGFQDGFSLVAAYSGRATSICDLMA